MKHLYKKIYLTIIASLVVLVLVGGFVWKVTSDKSKWEEGFNIAAEIATSLLPKPDTALEEQKTKVTELAKRLKIDIALYTDAKKLIVETSEELPFPVTKPWHGDRRFYFDKGSIVAHLPDERWLVLRLRPKHDHKYGPLGGLLFLAAIAGAIAIAVYPAVRGLTRRLERLQTGVENLGTGDLTTRVAVEGKDEVARLAKSFNASAAKIEQLMKAHKLFLANASHELRTPLSRLRVAVELLKDKADPKNKKNLETDIAELDHMIDEILLASRLNTLDELGKNEEVDLLALIAEETARYPGYDLQGDLAKINGDPRLLRRMVRNLLENANRYGKPPVTVTLENDDTGIKLEVCDAGDGIAKDDIEKIFEPFYRPEGSVGTSGSGLGLSLVRQIARRHGGDAIACLKKGNTCFRVYLKNI